MQCLSSLGTYSTPIISNSYIFNTSRSAVSLFKPGLWPNCTFTVSCGQPPDPPVNGSIKWLNGANTLQVNNNIPHPYSILDVLQCNFFNNITLLIKLLVAHVTCFHKYILIKFVVAHVICLHKYILTSNQL